MKEENLNTDPPVEIYFEYSLEAQKRLQLTHSLLRTAGIIIPAIFSTAIVFMVGKLIFQHDHPIIAGLGCLALGGEAFVILSIVKLNCSESFNNFIDSASVAMAEKVYNEQIKNGEALSGQLKISE